MGDLTKTELLEKLLKLLQTDRDMNFLLSQDEKDLTTWTNYLLPSFLSFLAYPLFQLGQVIKKIL
jgi:hypothetical protein